MAHHNIGVLINRQMHRWDLQHPASAAAVARPTVAISRLPHSGGIDLGRRAAELLDFGLFDREIVEQIATEQGIQQRLVVGLDERVRSGIDRYISDTFQRQAFTESDYLRHLVRIIATIGRRGMAVILGRGAAFILPPERTLRVLVVAPAAFRAQHLAEAEGLPLERAAAQIADLDEERRRFHQHHFGVGQEDPLQYDLAVNTAAMSIDSGAELVASAARSRFALGKRTATGSQAGS